MFQRIRNLVPFPLFYGMISKPKKVTPTVITMPETHADCLLPAESLMVLRFKPSEEETQ